ncbi:MAG: type I-MYXAN CRISPR-associated Cas8a1/Cmx1 [Gemmataceae bacterium]
MGRQKKPVTAAAPAAPDHLTTRLFAPGMSALHRAGLGGLACTLKYIERAYRQGALSDDDVPGGPWADPDVPPWTIEPDHITLRFGAAGNAREFLKRLYALGFTLADDMIHLPAQHRMPPTAGIRADLQLGITLTFLQHGKTRALAKVPTVANHDPEGTGVPAVTVEYRACSGFRHQTDWEDLIDPKTGRLTDKPVGIEGPLNPGATVRHIAYTAATQVDDPVERLLPLHFALVGCVALPVNRGVGVLLVPEVEDVVAFAKARPFLTPAKPREGFVSGGADAALQMQVRLKAQKLGMTACHAVTFRPTAWASQQKSRVHTVHVPVLAGADLDVYDIALAHLPPRIVTRTEKESTGKGRTKVTTERQVAFRTDSVVRPLIADNLATGRRWYAGFTRLMTATNPATDKPFRDAVRFEQRGLHAMVTDSRAWADHEADRLVVQAVHEAIGRRLGQIRKETDGESAKVLSQATKNRWERFRERLRLDLAGAKTEAHVRFALMDLFSRAGANTVLRAGWATMLPVVRTDWQLARDLGLLALSSYAGRSAEDTPPDTTKPEPTAEE